MWTFYHSPHDYYFVEENMLELAVKVKNSKKDSVFTAIKAVDSEAVLDESHKNDV